LHTSQTWLDDYLDLLGLEREPPSLDLLNRLTRAHLARVPFENITSILRRAAAGTAAAPPIDRDAELRAWRERRGGGLCFEVTDMFGTLLTSLGFQTEHVIAVISFPGQHQSVLVHIDDRRYLVDAGNGAPFFEAVPVSDSDPLFEIYRAGLGYRFRAEGAEGWVQDRLIDGKWQPFCTYLLAPADRATLDAAYQRLHTLGQSWVVDTLTLIRCGDSDVWTLRDSTLSHFTADGKSVSSCDSIGDYRRAVAEIFELPNAPIEQALEVLSRPVTL
jgi:arylamine N-acetyltransferase